ncbi:MAG: acylphosphatase [Candidatus Bathyarchaeota archaeon]|nr:acylphosphatase [Candidatus Bathyarchaeota archaeon]
MAKARILVEGTVQGVGYRAHAKRSAEDRGISGLVRNVSGGRVEVFCEGPRAKIERFVDDLYLKRPGDKKSPYVRKLTIHWEGEPDYGGAWKSYEGFEIDYGTTTPPTPYEKETMDSLEWAKYHFTRLEEEFISLRKDSNANFSKLEEGVGSLRRESNENLAALGGNMGGLRTETANNFDSMARKYGSISKEVTATKKELKKSMDGLKNSIDSLPERMTNALLKGLKSEKPDS